MFAGHARDLEFDLFILVENTHGVSSDFVLDYCSRVTDESSWDHQWTPVQN
jgi:hypothetical protein